MSPDSFPRASDIHISISVWCYFGYCILAELFVRLVNSVFKSGATHFCEGEQKDSKPTGKKHEPRYGFWIGIWYSFHGFKPPYHDFLLPYLIGCAELAAYPVLFSKNQLQVIAGWLVIRTAASWGGWGTSRTSYYRFLLAQLLNLGLAYFWLSRYVS